MAPAARAEIPLALPDPGGQCRAAVATAEAEHALPPALLGAIARAESGRAEPGGGLTPWPWTLNAEGVGRWYASKAEAVAEVLALRARGVTVIDVGCLQVNLHHHPQAFASLEEAFDPLANARYAARFLRQLGAQAGGDWVKAVGHYHSQTPDRAAAYRQRVLAGVPQLQRQNEQERRRALMAAAWQATRQPPPSPAQQFHLVEQEIRRREAAARQQVLRRLAAPRRAPLVELAEARR